MSPLLNAGLDRITFDPKIMGGRACIRGIRITVALIVNLVANGMTPEAIRKEYPVLETEDIRQALHYVAALANEQLYPLTLAASWRPSPEGTTASSPGREPWVPVDLETSSPEGATAARTLAVAPSGLWIQ